MFNSGELAWIDAVREAEMPYFPSHSRLLLCDVSNISCSADHTQEFFPFPQTTYYYFNLKRKVFWNERWQESVTFSKDSFNLNFKLCRDITISINFKHRGKLFLEYPLILEWYTQINERITTKWKCENF